ncbi:hypothetical protein [Limnoglobus roseus]|uniref:Uncharacterized protein n=1 Tax=Limnoglobus roseus TaxID=2598579 RepID=A0A5C1ASQ3_9BACT|nr:hypothetical protein [Limnoglobus roseus]QEL19938.1 hypothetical protein PX52LOC_07021 [Limnoglobus roseus]
MATLYRLNFLAALLLLAATGPAAGGEFADGTGFSITYPDEWVALRNDQLGDLRKLLPTDFTEWVRRNNLDLKRIEVLIVCPGRGEFFDSLNLIIDDHQVPLTDKAIGQVADELIGVYAKMGVTVEDFRARADRVGPRDAVVIDFTSRFPDDPLLYRHRQVLIPGGGRTYIVTCSSTAAAFDQHAAAFDAMLASVKAPPPAGKPFPMDGVVRIVLFAVVFAIAGGVARAAGTIVSYLRTRRRGAEE